MGNGWPFFLTSTKTYTKLVPDISEDEAIGVLHDPLTLIHLNPLVFKAHALDPSQPMLYTIHDILTVFKVFKTEIVYTVDFSRTSWVFKTSYTDRRITYSYSKGDGMDSQSKAGAGTTVKGEWRARRQDSGEIEISETVTVRVSEKVQVRWNHIDDQHVSSGHFLILAFYCQHDGRSTYCSSVKIGWKAERSNQYWLADRRQSICHRVVIRLLGILSRPLQSYSSPCISFRMTEPRQLGGVNESVQPAKIPEN